VERCVHKGRTLLLGCSVNGTDKIPPFIAGSRENLVVSKISEFAHTRTVCSKQRGWVSQAILTGHLRVLNAQLGSKNRKFIDFGDHCAACPQINLTFISCVFFPKTAPPFSSHLTRE